MDVSVWDGLARGLPVIQTHVEAIGLELFDQLRPDRRHKSPDRLLNVVRQIVDALNVLLGYHERVTIGDRETVTEGDGVVIG